MFAEDIFDGWLAVHGSFLSEESERVLEAPSYISPVESSDLNDIANVNKQNLSQSYVHFPAIRVWCSTSF